MPRKRCKDFTSVGGGGGVDDGLDIWREWRDAVVGDRVSQEGGGGAGESAFLLVDVEAVVR